MHISDTVVSTLYNTLYLSMYLILMYVILGLGHQGRSLITLLLTSFMNIVNLFNFCKLWFTFIYKEDDANSIHAMNYCED